MLKERHGLIQQDGDYGYSGCYRGQCRKHQDEFDDAFNKIASYVFSEPVANL